MDGEAKKKTKKKKVDLRIEEEMNDQLILLGWFCKKSVSEMIRKAILYYLKYGKIVENDENKKVVALVEEINSYMLSNGLTMDDIRPKEVKVPPKIKTDVQALAEFTAREVQKAVSKHCIDVNFSVEKLVEEHE